MINEKTIILLLFLTLIGIGLAGCKTVCPDKTSVTVSTTDTESVNNDNEDKDKFQLKKSISQSWKWGKKKCNEN